MTVFRWFSIIYCRPRHVCETFLAVDPITTLIYWSHPPPSHPVLIYSKMFDRRTMTTIGPIDICRLHDQVFFFKFIKSLMRTSGVLLNIHVIVEIYFFLSVLNYKTGTEIKTVYRITHSVIFYSGFLYKKNIFYRCWNIWQNKFW